MTTNQEIQNLEQQLAIARGKNIIEYIHSRLDQYRDQVGKCYVSHVFFKQKSLTKDKLHRYLSKGRNIYICRIKDIVWGDRYGSSNISLDDPSQMQEHYISEQFCAKFLVDFISIVNTTFDDSIRIRREADKYESCRNNFIHLSARHEITVAQFEQMWQSIEVSLTDICIRMGSVIPVKPEAHRHDEMSTKELEELGCKFVDLNTSEEYLLSDRIPLVWQGKLWACKETVALLENWIKTLQDSISRTTSFDYGGEHISAYKMSEFDRRQLDEVQSILERVKNVMQ